MKVNRTKVFAAAVAVTTILACGNDELGQFLNTLIWGVPNDEDVIKLVLGGDRIELNSGKFAYLPPGDPTGVGGIVTHVPEGTIMFRNAWATGPTSISMYNLNNSTGGVSVAKLVQDGNDLKLDKGLAFPPGKWDLQLSGSYRFLSEEPSKSLTVGTISYNFDVFNVGGKAFSNVPLTLEANLPANGKSQAGFTMRGTLGPNGGQGPVYLDLKEAGKPFVTFNGNKALSATEWTISSTSAIATPTEGWDAVRLRIQF